jgi:hypothetical protein
MKLNYFLKIFGSFFKYYSRGARELIEVLINAAENGKQLDNLICCLPNHLLKLFFILGISLKHRDGDSLLEI